MNISPRRQLATSLYALLLTLTLPGTSAAAQAATPLPPNVGTADCDRACLRHTS